MPSYDAGPGLVKVPAAWLIEHAGFAKGYGAPAPARVSTKHTLALVNTGNATTADLLALAREIVSGVHVRLRRHPDPRAHPHRRLPLASRTSAVAHNAKRWCS